MWQWQPSTSGLIEQLSALTGRPAVPPVQHPAHCEHIHMNTYTMNTVITYELDMQIINR